MMVYVVMWDNESFPQAIFTTMKRAEESLMRQGQKKISNTEWGTEEADIVNGWAYRIVEMEVLQ